MRARTHTRTNMCHRLMLLTYYIQHMRITLPRQRDRQTHMQRCTDKETSVLTRYILHTSIHRISYTQIPGDTDTETHSYTDASTPTCKDKGSASGRRPRPSSRSGTRGRGSSPRAAAGQGGTGPAPHVAVCVFAVRNLFPPHESSTRAPHVAKRNSHIFFPFKFHLGPSPHGLLE